MQQWCISADSGDLVEVPMAGVRCRNDLLGVRHHNSSCSSRGRLRSLELSSRGENDCINNMDLEVTFSGGYGCVLCMRKD